MTFDPAGRMLTLVDPRGNEIGANPADYTTTYTYDTGDHLLTITSPLGHVDWQESPYVYARNSPVSQTDPSGLLASGLCVSLNFRMLGSTIIAVQGCLVSTSTGEIGIVPGVGPEAFAGDVAGASVGVVISNASTLASLKGPFFNVGGQGSALGRAGAVNYAIGSSCGMDIHVVTGSAGVGVRPWAGWSGVTATPNVFKIFDLNGGGAGSGCRAIKTIDKK